MHPAEVEFIGASRLDGSYDYGEMLRDSPPYRRWSRRLRPSPPHLEEPRCQEQPRDRKA